MVERTQQDVLYTVKNMIKEYCYHTEQNNSTSCNITYVIKIKNDSIAGCVGIENNVIKHLRIKKKFRRCGIGTSLLNKAENIIKKQFYFESLAFVHCENRAAIKLFDKNGYLPVSVNDYCYYLRKIL